MTGLIEYIPKTPEAVMDALERGYTVSPFLSHHGEHSYRAYKQDLDALTPRQASMLRFLQEWNRPFSPTYEDMRIGLGYAARSTIHYIIQELVAKGLVAHSYGQSRSVRLL